MYTSDTKNIAMVEQNKLDQLLMGVKDTRLVS
jgi:hypothetical protein